MAKLISHHGKEHYHIHALFGLLTLVHFFWRFSLLVVDRPNVGYGLTMDKDLISLLILALPQSTAFLFSHVPVKKGTDDGFTIWKEYRWHAFIFSARSWILLAYYLLQNHLFSEEEQFTKGICIATVYSAMFAAQTVTDWYPKQSSTIRGMYKTNIASSFAGFAQFLATAIILSGPKQDRIGIQFSIISAIQLNAFNMTLRKKRIIGGKTSQAFYSTLLILGAYLFVFRRLTSQTPKGIFDPRFEFVYLASTSYFARRVFHYSRFASWTIGLLAMETLSKVFGAFA